MARQHTFIIFILTIALMVAVLQIKPPEVVREVETEIVYVEKPQPKRTPEFREPPTKQYKPPHFQQMGLLLGEDGSTLPLYGQQTFGYRDRYNYYTTTPGQQIYSLPINHQNQDCTEDIGCKEFYGGETVEVTGRNTPYSTKIYKNKTIRNLLY